ncbi:hypothetical protein D3C87_1812860 [compost metagenome]
MRDPKNIEKILRSCGASNLPSFQNALALNTNVYRDLVKLRNFYAHRCKDTWQVVDNLARNLGVVSLDHPDDLVCYVITGRPVTIFEDWLSDVEIFFEEAIK